MILGILPDRKLARGTKGRGAYEDLLEEFQLAKCGGPGGTNVMMLACPTCNAFAYRYELNQVAQGEFLRQGMAVLTPSVLVSFEDGQSPPLYRDENAGNDGKPRWRLCQGVGPAGLELDRSRTGRIHKPSLAPFGVDVRPLTLPEQLRGPRELSEAVHEACDITYRAMGPDVDALEEERLLLSRPIGRKCLPHVCTLENELAHRGLRNQCAHRSGWAARLGHTALAAPP